VNTAEQLGEHCMRIAVEELRQLRTLWPVTPQQSQEEILERLRTLFREAISAGIESILGAGFPTVELSLAALTGKAESVKVVGVIQRDKLRDVVDALGTKCVLVLVDPAQYTSGMESFASDDDQRPLKLDE
jgi:hypothetical protein